MTVLIFSGLIWAIVSAPSSSNAGIQEQVTFDDRDAPVIGPTDAPLVIHAYGDFQCPACRVAEAGVQAMLNAYTGKVRYVWKDFPLTQLHPNAQRAAHAARCAEADGRFWQMHDLLYQKQDEWGAQQDPTSFFIRYAGLLGLRPTAFESCLLNQTHEAVIAKDVGEGNQNRVDRTPTFFVNNRRVFVATFEQWKSVLDPLLTP